MTLDQLQIFIAVAEREHLTRAADVLGLAPPSVSASVVLLEREFGTKLFHRVGRGIVITPFDDALEERPQHPQTHPEGVRGKRCACAPRRH